MSDEDLRALERAMFAGDPAAALELDRLAQRDPRAAQAFPAGVFLARILRLVEEANASTVERTLPATRLDVLIALNRALASGEGASCQTRPRPRRRVVIFAAKTTLHFYPIELYGGGWAVPQVVVTVGHSCTRAGAMQAARAAWPRLSSRKSTRLSRWFQGLCSLERALFGEVRGTTFAYAPETVAQQVAEQLDHAQRARIAPQGA